MNMPVIRQTEMVFAIMLAISIWGWFICVLLDWPLAMLGMLLISAVFSCGFIVFFFVVRIAQMNNDRRSM